MQRLTTRDARELWLGRSLPPHSFTCPAGASDYALLLVVADDTISPDDQAALSEQIVRSGCRHAVCFGPTSSAWDDSIDMVGVMDEVEGRPSTFVMTSWFDQDPLDDAVDFFVANTGFDDWIPAQFVVHVLGGDEALKRTVRDAVCARFR